MQDKTFYTEENEIRRVIKRWDAECEQRGTTLEDSSWTWSGGGTVYDGTQVAYTTSCLLNPQSSGVLTNTVTLANGERIASWRQVVVEAQASGVAEDETVAVIESEGGGLVEQE